MTAPKDGWKPTLELRWLAEEVMVDPFTLVDEKTLQQKWVKGRQVEWRKVPTIWSDRVRIDRW